MTTILRTVRAWAIGLLCGVVAAHGATFTPGNVLVTYRDVLYEYTMNGELVQSLPVPMNGGQEVRDAFLGSDGTLYLFNGTGSPVLTTYDGTTWNEYDFPGWSLVHNATYGGISEVAGMVFVTDMEVFTGDPKGILRFDTHDNFSAQLFPSEGNYMDLTIGLDCKLYALHMDELTVDIFDPVSMEELDTITLGTPVRGIAAAQNGFVFGASLDGNLYRFDTTGAQVAEISAEVSGLHDVDLNRDGQLVVGGNHAHVVVSSAALYETSWFRLGSFQNTFVTFVSNAGCVLPVFADGFADGNSQAWAKTVGRAGAPEE